ncbi:response regulator [Devosia aurantiaca]|uniref:Response regulator transcription factor n=1 Tax=Devosia aurantiaca TaxID=2714858 RepID=A0A6M1SPH4_9HYPH|nr:response regulator [Devosia aurantiaca]NGP17095.1 response regulator transcription factor [Devosia aurantiaca]
MKGKSIHSANPMAQGRIRSGQCNLNFIPVFRSDKEPTELKSGRLIPMSWLLKDRVLILVVEDEAMVAILIEEALTDAGYEVELAYSGPAAMQSLDKKIDAMDALITDVRLGGPSADGTWPSMPASSPLKSPLSTPAATVQGIGPATGSRAALCWQNPIPWIEFWPL